MTITTNSFARALFPGVEAWYGMEYNDHEPEYTHMFDVERSTRAYEPETGTSGLGLAQVKAQANSVAMDSMSQAYTTTYAHTTYGLGFSISREMMDDDLYDIVGKARAQALARSMRITKEINAALIYDRAFTTGYEGSDGSTLCSTSHANYSGGTWSNRPSVDSDLSEAALEQACTDIGNFTDDRGLPVKVTPTSLILAHDQIWEAHRILKSEFRVGTANNDRSALYDMGKFQKVLGSHYLSDTDAWFVRTDCPHGLKHKIRRDPDFTIDNDWDTENAKFKATERYVFGWTDPKGLYGCPGA